jgi:ribosomal protein S18 acetylase RimI-like enzyme
MNLQDIDKLHTTPLGILRIKKNLDLETNDVINWCKEQIKTANNIEKIGKNWYVYTGDIVITINANSYAIITAHRINKIRKIKKVIKMNMNDIVIRHANDNDYSWLQEHDEHISDKVLTDKIKNQEIYVAEIDEKIIGWLRYNLFWDNIPFMNMLYILEEYRNQGIGTKLTKYWEIEMKQKGYNSVLTSTQSNEDAQHFYRKTGYTEIGGFKYLDHPYEIIFQKDYKKL